MVTAEITSLIKSDCLLYLQLRIKAYLHLVHNLALTDGRRTYLPPLHASSLSSDRVLDLRYTACKINSTSPTILNLVFTSTGSVRAHKIMRPERWWLRIEHF